MKKRCIYIWGILGVMMVGLVGDLMLPVSVRASGECKDVQFVFARGSGAVYGESVEWQSWQEEVRSQMSGLGISYGVYEVTYPAIGLDFLTALSAFVSAGESFAFGSSVRAGVMDMVDFYNGQLSRCPNTRFVLAGYSQGAKVVAGALGSFLPAKVLYVAMLGDPNLYLPEGVGAMPPACRGEKLSSWRVFAPDCHTDSGVLGARKPYEVAGYAGKIGLWCNDDDLICGSSINLLVNDGHSTYAADGHVGVAVRQAILRIRQEFSGTAADSEGEKQAPMDTAVLIDSTGSMADYIAKYKAEALRLAKLTLAGGGRIALYEFRDLDDPFSLRQLCDFTCSLADFEQKLGEITVDGGGDALESLLSGTLGVMNSLEWKRGATKSIVALTDAGYLAPDRDGTTVAQVARRSLEIDPVNVYVITEERNRDFYAELAELTSGKVFDVGEMGASTDYIVSRPVAVLPFEKYYGDVGERFYFDASGSYGVGAEISHFEWDLDSDGVFEYVSAEPFFEVEFADEGERFVVVKVVAADGGFATMSALVMVGDYDDTWEEVPAPVDLRVEVVSDDELVLRWKLVGRAVYGLVAMNGVPLGYVLGEVGELKVGGVDFGEEVGFAVTGMDAGFNLGGTAEVFWRAGGEGAILEVEEAGKGDEDEERLTDVLELKLPDTGGGVRREVSVVGSGRLVIFLSLAVAVVWFWRKYRRG